LANHLHIVHLSRCYLGQPSIFRRFLLSPFGIEVVRAAEPRDFSRNLLVQRVWEGEAGEARGEEDEQLEKVPVACKAARLPPRKRTARYAFDNARPCAVSESSAGYVIAPPKSSPVSEDVPAVSSAPERELTAAQPRRP
jgi:hypothetical protein